MQDNNLNTAGLEPVDGGAGEPSLPGVSQGETSPHPLMGAGGISTSAGKDNSAIVSPVGSGSNSGSFREGGGGAPSSLGNAYSPRATPPTGLPNSNPSEWYIGPQHRGPSPPLRIGGSYGTDGLPPLGGNSGSNSGGFVVGPGGNNGAGSGSASTGGGVSSVANAGGGTSTTSDGATSGGGVELGSGASAGSGSGTQMENITGRLRLVGQSGGMPNAGASEWWQTLQSQLANGGNATATGPATVLGSDPSNTATNPSGQTTASSALSTFQDSNGNSLLDKMDPAGVQNSQSQESSGGNVQFGGGSNGNGGIMTSEPSDSGSSSMENGFPGGQIASTAGEMFGPHHA